MGVQRERRSLPVTLVVLVLSAGDTHVVFGLVRRAIYFHTMSCRGSAGPAYPSPYIQGPDHFMVADGLRALAYFWSVPVRICSIIMHFSTNYRGARFFHVA